MEKKFCQSWINVVQELCTLVLVYCSVCEAVDGTHFVRNLIRNDQVHQDLNKIIISIDCHYRSHRFDLYVEL